MRKIVGTIINTLLAPLAYAIRRKHDKDNLKLEISDNYKQIYVRSFYVLPKLLTYLFFNKSKRTPNLSYRQYDNYWNGFWKSKDIFRTDLTYTKFDKPITKLTPFEFKKNGLIKILSRKITENNISSVLEVGSGGGLNLMFLAPMFPNVTFIGLEPTESGVRITNEFINSPPPEFEDAYKIRKLKNTKIIKGSILDTEAVRELENYKFDLVYTSAVLEQLHNYVDVAFENIFKLTSKYFLFFEEWLEANYLIENYLTLVNSDYFRISWNYLNRYKEIEIVERSIPSIQPAWLKYGVVFGNKL